MAALLTGPGTPGEVGGPGTPQYGWQPLVPTVRLAALLTDLVPPPPGKVDDPGTPSEVGDPGTPPVRLAALLAAPVPPGTDETGAGRCLLSGRGWWRGGVLRGERGCLLSLLWGYAFCRRYITDKDSSRTTREPLSQTPVLATSTLDLLEGGTI